MVPKGASDKSCSANSDCYFLLDSRCISGFCTCDAGLVEEISSEGDKCVPVAVYIREPCKTDPKCSGLGPNSHCILDGNGQGHCECDTNNHFLLGKCWRSIGIGEECTSDDECYTKHNPHRVTCQNSRCGCFPIEQYRPNDDNTACVDSGSYSHIHQALLTVSIFLTMYAAF
uniref:EB domain-containing protein n=1 Tax=Timema douglasi TaxID=61478 RepID=A0A7R8VTR6_TIMDO|nr:unnamed protein product [Timema douglasi]